MSSQGLPFYQDPNQPIQFPSFDLSAGELPYNFDANSNLPSAYATPIHPYSQTPGHLSVEEAFLRGGAPSPSEQDPISIISGWHNATDEKSLRDTCFAMREIAKGKLAEHSMDPGLLQDILTIHGQTYQEKMYRIRELFSSDMSDFQKLFQCLMNLLCAWRSVCRIKVQFAHGVDDDIDDDQAERILMCEATVKSAMRGMRNHVEFMSEGQKLNVLGSGPDFNAS